VVLKGISVRVLYIEAKLSDCDDFQKAADAIGSTVDVVHSGRAGVDACVDSDYDIVAIGCHLFDMSGLDVARQILDRTPEQPLFLIINKDQHLQAVELMVRGVISYVIPEESNAWLDMLDGFFANLQSRFVKRRDHLEVIEALNKSEQRLQDFAESGSDWWWESDEGDRLIWESHTGDDESGLPASDIAGMTRQEIAGDLMTTYDWAEYQNAIDGRREIEGFEYNYRGADGSVRAAAIYGKPMYSEDGTYKGYRGTASNVTDRKRAEDELNQALVEAEQANRAKSEFLATMSHEFRTPLNAILGFSEMLRAQYMGPLGAKNYEDYANDIHHSGEHLLALINDILDISAIEAGKRSMSPEDINVRELVSDCVHNIEKLARDKGVEVLLDIPGDLPHVHADKRSLIQICYNILSNAVKFTDAGGIVQIIVSQQDDGILLQVEDSGIGISAPDLANITQPFAQVNSDPHNVREGTGLGLSIVKSLIEAHGGELEIVSDVGKGTTVSVSLPIGSAQESQTARIT
jgi:PAS domain S-box-containing protein